jgi:hypothetical protein
LSKVGHSLAFLISANVSARSSFSRWREKVPGLEEDGPDAPKEVPKGRT